MKEEIKKEEKVKKDLAVKKEVKEPAKTKPKKANTVAKEKVEIDKKAETKKPATANKNKKAEKVETAEKAETKKPVAVEKKETAETKTDVAAAKKTKKVYTDKKKENVVKFSKITAITASAIFVLSLICCFIFFNPDDALQVFYVWLLMIPFFIPLVVVCGVNTVKAIRRYHITNIVFAVLFSLFFMLYIYACYSIATTI